MLTVTVVCRRRRCGEEYAERRGSQGHRHSYELSVTFPQFENFDAKGVNIGWRLATRLDIVLRPK
jgi:hypothetical protein